MAEATHNIVAPAPPWLRIWLVVIAAIETAGALSDLPAVFYEYDHTTPLLIFAQALASAKLVLAVVIAGAALAFAIVGRVRHAIIALAVLLLIAWLSDLPSVFIHGLELSGDIMGLQLFVLRFIYPVVAVATLVLAIRNVHLVLAGVLVSVPTVIAVAGIIAFAISVSIYGF